MNAMLPGLGNKVWFIEKYARFLPAKTVADDLCDNSVDNADKGEWKYFSSSGVGNSQMKIALVMPLNLLITSGDSISLESFSLYGNDKGSWIKAVCKGDSMLFCCKTKEAVRRFRIKFGSTGDQTSQEQCANFVKIISKYIPIKMVSSNEAGSEMSQPLLTDSSQKQLTSSMEFEYIPPNKTKKTVKQVEHTISEAGLFAAKSTRQLAQELANNSFENLPGRYQKTNISSENLDALVKTCLMDSNFPAFVGQVECSLNSLLS